MKAAVIPSFRKCQNKQPKSQHYGGPPRTELDSRPGVRRLKHMIAALRAFHSAISHAKLLVQAKHFESRCVMN